MFYLSKTEFANSISEVSYILRFSSCSNRGTPWNAHQKHTMIYCFHAGVGRQTHHVCGQCQDLLLQSREAASLWIWRLPSWWQAQGPGCSRPAPENIPRSGMLRRLGMSEVVSYAFSVEVLGNEVARWYWWKTVRHLSPSCGWGSVFSSQRWGLKHKTKSWIIVKMKWSVSEKCLVSCKALSDFQLRNLGLCIFLYPALFQRDLWWLRYRILFFFYHQNIEIVT